MDLNAALAAAGFTPAPSPASEPADAAPQLSPIAQLITAPLPAALTPHSNKLIDIARVVPPLIERVAASGLEGRSVTSLFAAVEWAEVLRRQEIMIARRATAEETESFQSSTSEEPMFDPFVRFHILQELSHHRDVAFYLKRPRVEPQSAPSQPSSASSFTSLISSYQPPASSELEGNAEAQKLYLQYLCQALRQQYSVSPPTSRSAAAEVADSSNPTSDESLLLSASNPRANSTWYFTGEGLIHESSLTRFKLLPQSLQSLTPTDWSLLSHNIILVGTFERRCLFLGLTKDDLSQLKAYSAGKVQTAATGKGAATPGAASAAATLKSQLSKYGDLFLMYDILETIGRFSIHSLMPDRNVKGLSAPPPSMLLTQHGGILQHHLMKILKLGSKNCFRSLQILEKRGLATPVKQIDDLVSSGYSGGGGWRWFLSHYSPSLHSAARAFASPSGSGGNDSVDVPFSSLGSISADTPLQSFQRNMHELYNYYASVNVKGIRKRLKSFKDKETERILDLKNSVNGTTTKATFASSPSSPIKMEDEGGEQMEGKDGEDEAALSARCSSLNSYPQLDLQPLPEFLRESGVHSGYELKASVTAQIYRLMVERDVEGVTAAYIRTVAFKGYFNNKVIANHLQTLVKDYQIKSIADQTGKNFSYKYFTQEAYEKFTNLVTTGADLSVKKTDSKYDGNVNEMFITPTKSSSSSSAAAAAAASTSNALINPSSSPTPSTTSQVAGVTVPLPLEDIQRISFMPAFRASAAEEYYSHQKAAIAAATAAVQLPSSFPSLNSSVASSAMQIDVNAVAAAAAAAAGASLSLPPLSVVSQANALPKRSTLGKGTHARSTLATLKREAVVLDLLSQSSNGILRAMDISRVLKERETPDDVEISGDSAGLDSKSSTSLWNRLVSAGKIRLLNVRVPLEVSGTKNVLLLTLPEVDQASTEIQAFAMEVAKGKEEPVGIRARRKSGVTGMRSKTILEMKRKKEAGEEASDVEIGEEEVSMLDNEEKKTEMPAASPTRPSTSKRRKSKPAAAIDEVDNEEAENEDAEGGEEDLSEAERCYPLLQGFIRPRMARLRLLMERLWTRYSSPRQGVLRQHVQAFASEADKVEWERVQAMKSEGSFDAVLAAATSAASPVPSSLTASYLCFTNDSIENKLLLSDWMSFVGLRESDLPALSKSIVLCTESNFTKPIDDPELAQWIRPMLYKARHYKMSRIRSQITLAESMGLLTTISDSIEGSYILEPKVRILDHEYDCTTEVGRDEYWRGMREACLRVAMTRKRVQTKLRLEKVAQNGNPSQPARPKPEEEMKQPEATLTASTSASVSAVSQSIDGKAAAGVSRNLGLDFKHMGGSGENDDILPLTEANFPILSQFPSDSRFKDMYTRTSWVIGRPLDSRAVKTLLNFVPSPSEPPIPAARFMQIFSTHFKPPVTLAIATAYMAMLRYPFVKAQFDFLSLVESTSRNIFSYGKKPTTKKKLAIVGSSSGAAASATSGRLFRLNTLAAKRKNTVQIDAVPASVRGGEQDTEHIPQPVGVPFRRSTSQESQYRGGEDDAEEMEEIIEEEEPEVEEEEVAPAVAATTPPKPRKKTTRNRWTSSEDEKLIQVFNEWFMKYYAPNETEGNSALPRSELLRATAPLNPTLSTAAAGLLTKEAPIPSVNAFSAARMHNRDAAACRRRLEVLRVKGLLPMLVSVSSIGVSTSRSVGVSNLQRDVYPTPTSVSLMYFLQTIFAQSGENYDSRMAQMLIKEFESRHLDVVLKALRADRWVTQCKTNENQSGRSWKFSVGWHDLMKPQHVTHEVFQISREVVKLWTDAQRKQKTSLSSSSHAPLEDEDEDDDQLDGISFPHHFEIDANVRGGDVAAILHLLSEDRVELVHRIKELHDNENLEVLNLSAKGVPQLQTWIDENEKMDVMDYKPLVNTASTLESPSSTTSTLGLYRQHLGCSYSVLDKIDIPTDPSLLLSEDFLLPPGSQPSQQTASDDMDIDMEIDESDAQVELSPPAAIASAHAASSSSKPSASSASSIHPADPSVWLDTVEVIAVQTRIVQILDLSTADGMEWGPLAARFYGESVVPPRSPQFNEHATLFEKGLHRAMNFLQVLRVQVLDPMKERYVHAKYADRWVLPAFHSSLHAAEGIEADFSNTAILPHTWRNLDGSLNTAHLDALFDAIMSIVLHSPGISLDSLQRHISVLTPSELDTIIQCLISSERAVVQTHHVPAVSLFSQPYDALELSKKSKKRLKKKRKIEEESSACSSVQRLIFPTAQAFAM